MASTASEAERRGNNFNILRLMLALMVLLSHSFDLVDGGPRREPLARLVHATTLAGLALPSFFLISGYLILQSWQHDPHLWRFAARRALRIYPGFIVAVLISAFVAGPLGAASSTYFAELSVPHLLAKTLLLRAPEVPPVFEGTPYAVVNSPPWTISHEARCYAALALLGLAGVTSRPRPWLAISLGLTALSFVFRTPETVTFKPALLLLGDPIHLLRFAAFFCAGGCFYLYRERIRYRGRWALGAALLAVPALFHQNTARLALLTLGAYVLFWLAFAPIPALRRLSRSTDISYGTYLYGWPTQKLLLWYQPGLTPWALFGLATLLAGTCGLLSWHLVERPFLRRKPRAPAT